MTGFRSTGAALVVVAAIESVITFYLFSNAASLPASWTPYVYAMLVVAVLLWVLALSTYLRAWS